MDKKFIPKKIVEDNVEYVLFDNVFRMKETIDYAVTHNFPIKFVCTTYTCACEILVEIQEVGYSLTFKKIPEYMDGRKIYDKIAVYCCKID